MLFYFDTTPKVLYNKYRTLQRTEYAPIAQLDRVAHYE